MGMQQYTRELFESYVGQLFEFERPRDQHAVPDRVQLELLEVSSASGSPAAGFRAPFTLLFALRSAEPLAGGLHRIAHGDFEPCDWFVNRVVVPGRDGRLAYYQAVFG